MSWYSDPEFWKAIGIYVGEKMVTPIVPSVGAGWILYKMAAYREKKAEAKQLAEFEKTQNSINQRIQAEIKKQEDAQKKAELEQAKAKYENTLNEFVETIKERNQKKSDLDYFKSFLGDNTKWNISVGKLLDVDEEIWKHAKKSLNDYDKLSKEEEEKEKQKGDEQE